MKPNNNYYCTAALTSLTYAMKAQKALYAVGLHSDIVKLSAGSSKRGCEYGVQFPCELEDQIKRALRSSDIGVRRYLREGGEMV